MLSWALIFAGVAVIGSILGIGGITHIAFALAQLMFFGFLVMAGVVIVTRRGRRFLI